MIETLVNKAVTAGAEVVICRGKTFDDELQQVIGILPHPDLKYAPDNFGENAKIPKIAIYAASFYKDKPLNNSNFAHANNSITLKIQ